MFLFVFLSGSPPPAGGVGALPSGSETLWVGDASGLRMTEGRGNDSIEKSRAGIGISLLGVGFLVG